MLNLRMPKDHTASYVNAMASHFKDRIVLNSKITSVARSNEGITLKMDNGQQLPFDKIIFACNPDQALSLLEKSTDQEKRLLGAWKYLNGRIVVHTDSSYLPRRELCQSWTCLQSTENGQPHFSISGCTWMLPGVSSNSKYISTQHPNFPIRDDLVEFETVLRTPIFDHDSVRTIEDLPTLNGTMNSYYCGSYFGSGLHEAAVASAIAVARDLDVDWK